MDLFEPLQSNVIEASAPGGSTRVFSIGICATGRPSRLVELLGMIEAERFPAGFSLGKIIVVASACAEDIMQGVRRETKRDTRILLVEQRERRGKADAINHIIRERLGEFLVFVNADALPAQGAISRLLRAIGREDAAGVVSGSPVVQPRGGLTQGVLELMWDTHNACSLDMNHMHLSNHGTDELMVVRSDVIEELPEGIVNDGAYIAGRAHSRGYMVKYLPSSAVKVDVPSQPIDIIRQRRRILYGHMQIWRLLGEAPRTAESLVLLSPRLGIGLVVKTVARRPRPGLAPVGRSRGVRLVPGSRQGFGNSPTRCIRWEEVWRLIARGSSSERGKRQR